MNIHKQEKEMKTKNARITFSTLGLIIFVLACGLPSQTDTTDTVTPEIIESTAESSPPADISIQHVVIPVNLPDNQSGQAGDFDASNVLQSNETIGGDRFTYGRFERPFNANTMDVYFSQLDIVDTKVFQDDTWIFAAIVIKDLSASTSTNDKYAVEIDSNLNGKGDWLILGYKPKSSEWTVNGVQIYQDTNQDVGLDLPTLTDQGLIGNGDGFETMIFDQGQGNDPDSAWVRISPNNGNVIEFAIKQFALGSPAKFLINMWAGTSLLDPALFDINDQFTHEQAGAADKGFPIFYPIKEVSEIDNSCRMAVGFQPTGNEAGLCEAFIPDSPDVVATPCLPAITYVGCLP